VIHETGGKISYININWRLRNGEGSKLIAAMATP